MSTETQVTVKILSAFLGAIGSIYIGVQINSWVQNEREETKTLNDIKTHIEKQSEKQEGINVLQNHRTSQLESVVKDQSAKVDRIIESLALASIQLKDIEDSDKKKAKFEAR